MLVQIQRAIGVDLSPLTPLASTSCAFWLKYGLILADQSVIIVNFVGLALNVYYVAVYYFFTLDKDRVRT